MPQPQHYTIKDEPRRQHDQDIDEYGRRRLEEALGEHQGGTHAGLEAGLRLGTSRNEFLTLAGGRGTTLVPEVGQVPLWVLTIGDKQLAMQNELAVAERKKRLAPVPKF